MASEGRNEYDVRMEVRMMPAAWMASEGRNEYDVRMEVRMMPAARTIANTTRREDRCAS